MQSIKILADWLQKHATPDRYLFSIHDLRSLFPTASHETYKTLLSRSVKAGLLVRVCRGLYAYKNAFPARGLLLFHAAAHLRSQYFNYISLETVLSEAGVISQVPMNWISLMSSGRSSTISCGSFGTIEFIHTHQKPSEIMDQLIYDRDKRLWRASVDQALKDMNRARRNKDLIDWDAVHEFV